MRGALPGALPQPPGARPRALRGARRGGGRMRGPPSASAPAKIRSIGIATLAVRGHRAPEVYKCHTKVQAKSSPRAPRLAPHRHRGAAHTERHTSRHRQNSHTRVGRGTVVGDSARRAQLDAGHSAACNIAREGTAGAPSPNSVLAGLLEVPAHARWCACGEGGTDVALSLAGLHCVCARDSVCGPGANGSLPTHHCAVCAHVTRRMTRA